MLPSAPLPQSAATWISASRLGRREALETAGGKPSAAEKVFSMVFPAVDQAAEGIGAGEEPLHIRRSALAAQRSAI
jgi:hypothetical protein